MNEKEIREINWYDTKVMRDLLLAMKKKGAWQYYDTDNYEAAKAILEVPCMAKRWNWPERTYEQVPSSKAKPLNKLTLEDVVKLAHLKGIKLQGSEALTIWNLL